VVVPASTLKVKKGFQMEMVLWFVVGFVDGVIQSIKRPKG
jgi:hypothetical protein